MIRASEEADEVPNTISRASNFTFNEYPCISGRLSRYVPFYIQLVTASRVQDLELQKYQAKSGVMPIDCKLFRLDVLESTWLLSFLRASLLDEQIKARREPMNVAAGFVLGFCATIDPT